MQQHHFIRRTSLANKLILKDWIEQLREINSQFSDESTEINYALQQIAKYSKLDFELDLGVLSMQEINEAIALIGEVNFQPRESKLAAEAETPSEETAPEPLSHESYAAKLTVRLLQLNLVANLPEALRLTRQLSDWEIEDFLEEQYLYLTQEQRAEAKSKAEREREAEEFADELRAGKMFGVGPEDLGKIREGFLKSMRRPKEDNSQSESDTKKPESEPQPSKQVKEKSKLYNREEILEQIRQDFPDQQIL